MADAGDLDRFPPEIRFEIYNHLLVIDRIVPIKRVHRAKSKRQHDTVALQSQTKRSTEVLRVNKFMNEEAAPVLYGCNNFEFLNAMTLNDFLQQIGDAKRHLRHVAFHQDGFKFMKSWKSMQHSIQLLASERGVRNLQFSHSAFCRNGTLKIPISELVKHCKPLLQALNVEFVKKDLGTSVLDIIDIVLPRSNCESTGLCSTTGEHGRKALITNYTSSMFKTSTLDLQCGCRCGTAQDVNDRLKTELKEEIAKQLKLGLP